MGNVASVGTRLATALLPEVARIRSPVLPGPEEELR